MGARAQSTGPPSQDYGSAAWCHDPAAGEGPSSRYLRASPPATTSRGHGQPPGSCTHQRCNFRAPVRLGAGFVRSGCLFHPGQLAGAVGLGRWDGSCRDHKRLESPGRLRRIIEFQRLGHLPGGPAVRPGSDLPTSRRYWPRAGPLGILYLPPLWGGQPGSPGPGLPDFGTGSTAPVRGGSSGGGRPPARNA
jgi:hypothetical protein